MDRSQPQTSWPELIIESFSESLYAALAALSAFNFIKVNSLIAHFCFYAISTPKSARLLSFSLQTFTFRLCKLSAYLFRHYHCYQRLCIFLATHPYVGIFVHKPQLKSLVFTSTAYIRVYIFVCFHWSLGCAVQLQIIARLLPAALYIILQGVSYTHRQT